MRLWANISFVARYALAWIYRCGYSVSRRVLYRPKPFCWKSRLIIIGSFLSGGAGKTPLVAKMAGRWALRNFRVAVLCHRAAWDEFEMLQKSLVGVDVFLTANRYELAKNLDGDYDVILCDGGLEDTRFVGADIFVLRWAENADSIKCLIPLGNCVSLEKDHPDAIPVECFRLAEKSKEVGFTKKRLCAFFGISQVKNYFGESLSAGAEVCLVTGLGAPERFVRDVETLGMAVKKKVFLPDHSPNYARYLNKELRENYPIVLSEKDAARLDDRIRKNARLYVAKEEVEVGELLDDYLNAAAGGAFKNPPSTL